jgi:XTP/dITP diphosphohydrolase
LDTLGPEGILRLVEGRSDRRASVSTCIAYADGKDIYTFVGTVSGTITDGQRGEGGFGYDSIFVPNGSERTYAEMTAEEKNGQSMRRLALEKLQAFFSEKNASRNT